MTDAAEPVTAQGALQVSLLTGGGDYHYAAPLAEALAARGVQVDVVCSEQFLALEMLRRPGIRLVNYHGDASSGKSLLRRVRRVLSMYARLALYPARSDSRLFHILWNNKFEAVDRTLLLVYYKLFGKKLLLTAHNVDAEERDQHHTVVGQWSLRFMYRTVDHIFVHTSAMKRQLEETFAVDGKRVTVIPFGLNTVPACTKLTRVEARTALGLDSRAPTLLFFGNIAPYKGLEYLIEALALLRRRGQEIRLVIAGNVKGSDAQPYWARIERMIREGGLTESVTRVIRFISDEEIELFFKAADACVLPYRHIFQTGVLFLAYRYGLPVIATDVGAVRDDVIESETGFICRPLDSEDLARAITEYFASPLFANLESARRQVSELARRKYSWDAIAGTVASAYSDTIAVM